MEFSVNDHVEYVGGGRVFHEPYLGKTGTVSKILSRSGEKQKVEVVWDEKHEWPEEQSAWPYSENLRKA